jgi:poly(beta-D-mannuronate) lyase
MADGVWTNQDIDFAGDGAAGAPITLRAETPDGVTLNGTSRLSISGSHLVVDGLNFDGGGSNSMSYLIEFRGSDGDAHNCRLTNSKIIDYNAPDRSHQYHWVEIFGQDNRVDHCLFEGQDHEGVTLVVRLDDNGQAARHLIDHNAFLDRPVGRDSNGHEMMRIGTSARNGISAQCVVEHNLFENCDGEIEIISNKSADNVYRYNTFRSCAGTLTLRHGKAATVSGNFFLGEGKNRSGGIRVVDSDHVIVNNYFDDIDDRADAAISLVAGINGGPANGYQPVKDITIHNNTIVDVGGAAIIFDWGFGDTDNGGTQNQLPENVSIVNNLIRTSGHVLFEGQEGSGWTWTDNIAFGASLGISSRPGLQTVNPLLSVASDGLWRPDSNSPAIDGGTTLAAITIDMDGQSRVGTYDIGADEASTDTVTLTPLAVADVGPYTETSGPTDPPVTGTIVDDSFVDGITNSGAQQIGFNVTSSNSALDLSQAPGPVDFATGNSGRTIHGLFPAQTLTAFGDVLTVTFDFTTPATIAYDNNAVSTNEDFKFGLFNTAPTAGDIDVNTGVAIDFNGPVNTSSGTPNLALNGLAGFMGEIDNINASGSDLGIRTNNVNGDSATSNQTGQFLNSNTGFDFISGGTDDVIALVPNTDYVGTLSVAYADAALASLQLTVGIATVDGAFTDIHTDTVLIADDPGNQVGVNTTTFDMLAFHATSGAFGGTDGPASGSSSTGDANNGIDISNVTITFENQSTPVLLGDVNLDGSVDFLDISPFIAVLSSGGDQAEADCNEDGSVDFLDISPFIGILSGS